MKWEWMRERKREREREREREMGAIFCLYISILALCETHFSRNCFSLWWVWKIGSKHYMNMAHFLPWSLFPLRITCSVSINVIQTFITIKCCWLSIYREKILKHNLSWVLSTKYNYKHLQMKITNTINRF